MAALGGRGGKEEVMGGTKGGAGITMGFFTCVASNLVLLVNRLHLSWLVLPGLKRVI